MHSHNGFDRFDNDMDIACDDCNLVETLFTYAVHNKQSSIVLPLIRIHLDFYRVSCKYPSVHESGKYHFDARRNVSNMIELII